MMKYESDPADYIPKARSMPGVEYEGDWGGNEWAQWDRYLRLHAGLAILLGAMDYIILDERIPYDGRQAEILLAEKIEELATEIEAMR